jgi:hypothetical protein
MKGKKRQDSGESAVCEEIPEAYFDQTSNWTLFNMTRYTCNLHHPGSDPQNGRSEIELC